MEVGVDAGGLHPPVPDIAEDVGRDRRARQQNEPHGESDQENRREPAASRHALRLPLDDEPSRRGVGHRLQQQDNSHLGVVELRNSDCAGERQGYQANRQREKRPIETGDPLHSASLSNSPQARRSFKSEVSSSDCISARECRASWGRSSRKKDRPSNSCDLSIRSAPTSSSSYHFGSTCTDRSSSAARSSVCRATCSVLQAMSWNSRGCIAFMPSR